MVTKRVVLVYWKKIDKAAFAVYSNLQNFCRLYPEYSYNTINNYLSKKGVPFEDEKVWIERLQVIDNKTYLQPQMVHEGIQRVVQIRQQNAYDEDSERVMYWMSRPAWQRLAEVARVSGHTSNHSRLDRRFVRKRKLGRNVVRK